MCSILLLKSKLCDLPISEAAPALVGSAAGDLNYPIITIILRCWERWPGAALLHPANIRTPRLHTLPTPSNFKPSRCDEKEREKIRMPSSNLMSALSRQKYTPDVVAVVVAGAIMPWPGVSWRSVTRSPLTGGQWVPGKLNKHRPPSYFWSAALASAVVIFTGYLPWLRGTVNVLQSHE